MKSLENEVALVTGATKGIGLATAEHLLERGARVAFCGRSQSGVDDLQESLDGRFPGRVAGFACDVRDEASVGAFVEGAVAQFGGLTILVNNAGLGVFQPMGELSVDDWRLQIDTNLTGVFLCTNAALPHLKRADGAWIINVGSLASRNAFSGGVGYNASKFGLLGMTEAMMLDLRYEDIRVSLIMPGSVNTEFRGRAVEDESWRLSADDCARAIVDMLHYPSNAHPSRIELRPSQPPR